MKNKLTDLQNHIFVVMETLLEKITDETAEPQGDKLKELISASLAFNEVAKTAVTNAALIAKCVDTLYGIPVDDDIPLLPKSQNEKYLLDSKKQSLLPVPKTREDEGAGYKSGGGRNLK